jgi:hypothetical protein
LIDIPDIYNSRHRTVFNGKTFKIASKGDEEHYKSVDPINEYKVDKYGFRSEIAAADILVAGCSYTFGIGVPKETTWGSVVGRGLGSSVASVAIPGASIAYIVEQIYIYFRTYDHPKKLFCLFPDLGRLPVVVDGLILSEADMGPGHGDGLCTVHTSDRHDLKAPKYLKKPYPITYTTTSENAAYWSVRAIRGLEQYCSAAGIEFIWSTWDEYFNNVATHMSIDKDVSFNNYFNVYEFECDHYKKDNGIDKETIFKSRDSLGVCEAHHKSIDCSCGLDCHSELLDLYGPKNFHLGADTLRGADHAHPGIHLQAHFGEAFLKQIKHKGDLKKIY